jgi:hypothetical protein
MLKKIKASPIVKVEIIVPTVMINTTNQVDSILA